MARCSGGLLQVTAVIAALGAAIYANVPSSAAPPEAPHAPAASAKEAHAGPIGALDRPAAEASVATRLEVSGWALDPTGIREVLVRLGGRSIPAAIGLPRPDVAKAKPGYPQSQAPGFALDMDLPDLAPQRWPYSVVAVNQHGEEQVLARRSLVPPAALRLWPETLGARRSAPKRPFYFLMATSGIAQGGAVGVKEEYAPYVSTTFKIGITVPILYLRTTKGRAADWVFDPDFDTSRKCGERPIADDSLGAVMRFAIAHRVPVQFGLNGGIWGDAACDVPQWDVNDRLEQDVGNCQWTQDNRVFPDDYLKNLAGSTASPELARSLVLNAYATEVRHYKKRNLQQAARQIAAFARAHPDLFVGVSVDPDTYINPFFEEREFFDYNPNTLRQFREWLRGAGPYAGRPRDGAPDLRAWRRSHALTLAEVNKIAGKRWTRWDEVDPPRRFPGSARMPVAPGTPVIWDDPWFREWDTFRKHLVALAYADLTRWAAEAGIAKDRIFTAQGFVAPEGNARPFAVRIDSAGQNYDSGGVSVQGAIPPDGHLGAILYGPAAENNARMEGRHGLFATFARMDPGWAVIESNLADLKRPQIVPTYAQGYRSLRDLFNYDARQIAFMAWNGSNGIFAGQPGYVSYTSWRNTAAEEAMRDHLVSHAGLPHGARLWTFGTAQHRDDDGWSAQGATLQPAFGAIALEARSTHAALVSPADQVIRRSNAATAIVGVARPMQKIEVLAQRAPGSRWESLGYASVGARTRSAAGVRIPLHWPGAWPADAIVERLRVEFVSQQPIGTLAVDRIALLPRRDER